MVFFLAFDYLLRQLPDLILDTPDAADILGNFMARAIADDCIPPKFLKSYKGHVEDVEAKCALQVVIYVTATPFPGLETFKTDSTVFICRPLNGLLTPKNVPSQMFPFRLVYFDNEFGSGQFPVPANISVPADH